MRRTKKESEEDLCERCHKNASEVVLYPGGVDPVEFEAGDAEAVCSVCMPKDAVRLGPFSFQASA